MKKIHKEIKLKVPIPVSVNQAYTWTWKRRKSESYKDFIEAVKYALILDWNDYKIIWDEWLEVKYEFYFKIYNKDWTKKKKDTFNYEKTLSDTLWKFIPWFSDHKIKRWFVEKFDSEEEFVLVTIKEILK